MGAFMEGVDASLLSPKTPYNLQNPAILQEGQLVEAYIERVDMANGRVFLAAKEFAERVGSEALEALNHERETLYLSPGGPAGGGVHRARGHGERARVPGGQGVCRACGQRGPGSPEP